jgi:uncharacterized membrane protein
MGILFGLSAALSWGVGDFLATKVTRRLGALRALMLTQCISFSVIALMVRSEGSWPQVTMTTWRFAFIMGVINFVATQMLYRAFQIGKLSLVSPLASSFTIVTALLAYVTGERAALLSLFGAALLLVGVILACQSPAEELTENENGLSSRAGLVEAGAASVCFGVVFWGMDRLTPDLGIYWPVLILRLVTLVGATAIWHAWARRQASSVITESPEEIEPVAGQGPRRLPVWWLITLVAFCATAAWLSFNAGTRTEFTTVVTALASLFSGITVLLARIFFHEELSRTQWAGVATILLGILLVSI